MGEKTKCVICGNPANFKPVKRNVIHAVCDRCGEYVLDGIASDYLHESELVTSELKAHLSAMARHQTNVRGQADIQLHDVKHLVGRSLPSRKKRLDALLLEIAAVVKEEGSAQLGAPRLSAASYSIEPDGTTDLLEQLLFDGLIEHNEQWDDVTLTPEGERKVSALMALVGVRDGFEYVRSTPTRAELEARDNARTFSAEFSDTFSKGPSLNPDGTFGQVPQFPPPIAPKVEGDGLWRLNLNVVPERSVVLSQVTSIRVDEHTAEVDASRSALINLKETLEGFIGSDSTDQGMGQNVQVVPMSEEDLQLIRSMVSAAIELENAPLISKSVAEFLSGLKAYLLQAKTILENTNEGARHYGPLLGLISALSSTVAAVTGVVVYFK